MPWFIPFLTTAASIAAAAAMRPKGVASPDTAAAQKAGIEADAETLGARRAIAAAAQLGTKVSAPGRMIEQGLNLGQIADGTQVKVGDQWVPYHAADFQQGGKYYGSAQTDRHSGQQFLLTRAPEQITADFTGLGDADIQAAIANQMAAKYLELGDKYGPAYIAEAKKQLELADPEGTAAREQLFGLIQQQIAASRERPLASELDRQIGDEAVAGNRMAGDVAGTLANATGAASGARGDRVQSALLRAAMEKGSAGEARATAGNAKALGWLTSGASPADYDYRRTQQDMANLAAFANGQGPVTQFASLSGAQRGATPLRTGQALPQASNTAGADAAAYGLNAWERQQQARLGQANGVMGGLSSLLSAGSTVAAAGK